MPTIEVSYNDLCKLIGKKIPLEELKERALWQAKTEMESATKQGNDYRLTLKPADTNRPDTWSVEGIARILRGKPLPQYKTKKSGVAVKVDPKVKRVRPHTVCAVVRGLKITDEILLQSIQLQDKVAGTFGRGRRDVAIGIYDLKRIKAPIYYTTSKPDELSFIPLALESRDSKPENVRFQEFKEKLTLRQILQQHPKGREFGHLLANAGEYPVFLDSKKNVLSMPPVINSDYTGKVTIETKDVFIECSGFDLKRLKTALNVVALALADRGGRLETVDVFVEGKKMTTPDLAPKKIDVDIAYARALSGMNWSVKEFIALLKKQQYDAVAKGSRVAVTYPAYRQDIMHPCDVVEDAIIAYGYEKLEPLALGTPTKGSLHPLERFTYKLEDALVGLGVQQVASYTLTNKRFLFERMNIGHAPVAEIENPQSENWSCFRTWLLPSVLEFLAANRHIEYPQEIFEIGECVLLDESADTKTRDVRKLAVVLTDTTVTYERIASQLDALMKSIGVSYTLKGSRHNSFIEGRVAEIIVAGHPLGYVGEVHPQVLNNWSLEKPVVAMEIDAGKLFEITEK